MSQIDPLERHGRRGVRARPRARRPALRARRGRVARVAQRPRLTPSSVRVGQPAPGVLEVVRAADRQRGRQAAARQVEDVNSPSSSEPRTTSRSQRARRADVLERAPVGEVGPEVRHLVVRPAAVRASPRAAASPWARATSKCSIRIRRPCSDRVVLAHVAGRPDARAPRSPGASSSATPPLSPSSSPAERASMTSGIAPAPMHDDVGVDRPARLVTTTRCTRSSPSKRVEPVAA